MVTTGLRKVNTMYLTHIANVHCPGGQLSKKRTLGWSFSWLSTPVLNVKLSVKSKFCLCVKIEKCKCHMGKAAKCGARVFLSLQECRSKTVAQRPGSERQPDLNPGHSGTVTKDWANTFFLSSELHTWIVVEARTALSYSASSLSSAAAAVSGTLRALAYDIRSEICRDERWVSPALVFNHQHFSTQAGKILSPA